MTESFDPEAEPVAPAPPSPPLTQPATSKVTLTKMLKVDIREAWPSEPFHFTPWLLENASELSAVLGIEVELHRREHPVGTFSLDLYGTVAGSDKVVIVENQYGVTDHNHLGQIMTYAGGTNPAIVVWIAETFKDEHRSALDWLNENTVVDVRFFGVRLSAIRLAGADPQLVAPHLELVCAPNDWDKLAKGSVAATGAGGGNMTPTNALYKQFWEKFAVHATKRGWTSATPPAQNWWSFPSGVSSINWIVSYANFGCRSELYFGAQDPALNLARLKALEAKKDQLQAFFGEGELLFDELPNAQSCRLEVRRPGPKIGQTELWDDVIHWMVDTQERLRSAIAQVGGLPV